MSTPFVRDVAWRFVAGEDLSAGLAVVQGLAERGIASSLNYLGTHLRDEAECVAAADAVIGSFAAIRDAGLESHVSVKLTQIGLDVRADLCEAQLHRILAAASEHAIFVRVDMEETPYVDQTIELFERARETFGIDAVGIVLQSYLRDRHGDLERLLDGGSRIRLVKGGYWEPESLVYRGAESDAAFLADIEKLMTGGVFPAIATHDERAVEWTKAMAMRIGMDIRAYEFQMLYGVRTELQEQLVEQGHVVRCYVPWGGLWYSYVLGCIRRLPGGAVRKLGRSLRD